MSIWGDAPTVARQLLTEAKKLNQRKEALAWSETLREDRSAFLAQRDADALIDANPIQPSGLHKTLCDVCPKESACTMDAGTLCL